MVSPTLTLIALGAIPDMGKVTDTRHRGQRISSGQEGGVVGRHRLIGGKDNSQVGVVPFTCHDKSLPAKAVNMAGDRAQGSGVTDFAEGNARGRRPGITDGNFLSNRYGRRGAWEVPMGRGRGDGGLNTGAVFVLENAGRRRGPVGQETQGIRLGGEVPQADDRCPLWRPAPPPGPLW